MISTPKPPPAKQGALFRATAKVLVETSSFMFASVFFFCSELCCCPPPPSPPLPSSPSQPPLPAPPPPPAGLLELRSRSPHECPRSFAGSRFLRRKGNFESHSSVDGPKQATKLLTPTNMEPDVRGPFKRTLVQTRLPVSGFM